EGCATEVVGGAVIKREVARTHQLARTGLDVAPLQVPSHLPYLLGGARGFPPGGELINRSRAAAGAPSLSRSRPPAARRAATSWRRGAPDTPARSGGRLRRRRGSARGSGHASRTRHRSSCTRPRTPPAAAS